MDKSQYYWAIGNKFKDGTIDPDYLPMSQRLALYGLSQQSKFGDNDEEWPSIWNIKAYKKHGAWLS